jgi:hypothetical protein
VGASRWNTVPTSPWNQNTIQPRIKLDPVNRDLFVAFVVGSALTTRGTAIQLWKQPFGGAFSKLFEPPQTTDSIRHDMWAPALSVYRYPTFAIPAITLTWRDTRADNTSTLKNSYPDMWATIKPHTVSVFDPIAKVSDSAGQIVDDFLGEYEGVAAYPRQWDYDVAVWGDQRNVGKTQVWGWPIGH